MTTRASRFQADIDPATGLFASGYMYDEQVVIDAITDELIGAGVLIGPTIFTDATHPALFAALNAQALKSDDRVLELRAKRQPKVDGVAVDEEISP